MTIIPTPKRQGESAVAHADWMVIQIGGHFYAVASDRIDVVFRTQEASVTQLIKPTARIEVHQGRPWFVVSLESLTLVQEFGSTNVDADLEWTIGLQQPQGLALHATSIEGPFRGLVTGQLLKTPQGEWPLLEWRS
jgi:hypothetical protein